MAAICLGPNVLTCEIAHKFTKYSPYFVVSSSFVDDHSSLWPKMSRMKKPRDMMYLVIPPIELKYFTSVTILSQAEL